MVIRCHKFQFVLAAIIIAVLSSVQAQSIQSIEWTPTNGPEGGFMYWVGVYTFSDILWMSTGAGNVISRDLGATWTQADTASIGPPLAFAPSGTVYTHRHVSFDNGYSWSRTGWPDSLYVSSMAVNNSTGNVFAVSSRKLYRSTDHGQFWTVLFENTSRVSTGADDVLFVRTRDDPSKFLYSDDGGFTWLSVPLSPFTIIPFEITSTPDGSFVVTSPGLFWISANKGQTWRSTSNLCNLTQFLGFDSEGRLYTYDRHQEDVARHPADLSSCELVTAKLELPEHYWFDTAGVGRSGLLFVNYNTRLFLSLDGGDNWNSVKKTGLKAAGINTLLVENSISTWWAGTEYDGLYRSRDAGETWEPFGFESEGILAIERGRGTCEYWIVVDQGGLYRTRDCGFSWSRVDSGLEYSGGFGFGLDADLHFDATRNVLYVYSPYLTDLFYTANDGATWHKMNAPFTSWHDPPIRAMEVSDRGTLYTAIRSPGPTSVSIGIYKTSDLGQTWEILSEDFPDVDGFRLWRVRILIDDSDWIWVSSEKHIFYSSNGGSNWTYSLETPDIVTDLIEGPYGTVWAVYQHGILQTTDRGATWENVTDSYDHEHFWTGAWDANRHMLVGGTYSHGIVRGTVVTSTAVENSKSNESPLPTVTTSVYPNPFSSSATVTYTLSDPSDIRLEVFDLLGKRVRLLESGFKSIGEHVVTFDASGLGSGVYFYTLTAGDFSQTRKMVVVK